MLRLDTWGVGWYDDDVEPKFSGEVRMFSVAQKRRISEGVQNLLRETNHPELPTGEISFLLHVEGAEMWSWADIQNNGAIENPSLNPWNEEAVDGPRD